MTKRIFNAVFATLLTVIVLSIGILLTVLYNYFSTEQTNHLMIQADLVANGVNNEGVAYLEGLQLRDYRVTWVAVDGEILYDNQAWAEDMENHNDRVEVQEARRVGFGSSTHFSETLTKQMHYVAERLNDGTILRLAVEEYTWVSFLLMVLQPLLLLLILSAVVAGILASRISKRLVQPLNTLDLDNPLENDTYEELTPLLRRLAGLHRKIDDQMGEIHQKQKEFDVVINYMQEGLAILSANGTIISMNQAAAEFFDTDLSAVGKSLLLVNRRWDVQEVMEKALAGQAGEAILPHGMGQNQMLINPVTTQGKILGLVVVILDVTEQSQAERLRREFTANVSHELKTPLHSISGCAEIIKNGLVQPQDVPQFVEQIYNEAQRLVVLVNDIIGLSRLDEGAEDIPREAVDLQAMSQDVVSRLQTYAETQSVSLTVVAEKVTLWGVPKMLENLCYNLCDNAIKYNRPGGSAVLSVHDTVDGIQLSIHDTGIGIPKEHQERIFERFYRVDKSHSKEIGGTGLGLSIVKRAALLHGGTVSIESTEQVGTTITILFPHKR